MSTQPPRGGPPERSPNGRNRPPRVSDTLRDWRFWLTLGVLLLINYLVVDVIMAPQQPTQVTLPYSTFLQQVESGNVVSITSQGDSISGETRKPVTEPGTKTSSTHFVTERPTFAGNDLVPLLEQHHVTFAAKPVNTGSVWTQLLLTFGPALLLIVGLVYLTRRTSVGAGGLFGFGQSRARLYDAERPAATFDDVAGIDEAKAELQEVVDFLRNPQRYTRLGGTVPKGVLLVGPPGTGKTLLARAVAGEARVPFFSVAASEFVEMIVGVGASRVRDLFQKARQAAPAIIFIDELDAIGRSRAGTIRISGGSDEHEQTLNQILTEMDGFDPREGVIVLAATNRADLLDPALLRPGRFDRRVMVQPPDRAGRAAILRIHTRHVPLAPDVDLDRLAQETPGLVGADLKNLVNEAALLAARRDRDAVAMDDFSTALEKVLLGAERKIMLTPEDRERVAYHESGHALLGLLVPGADPVRKVTIVPRGRALGVTVQAPVDDHFNYSEEYLRARIIGALGGRAAEQLVYGTTTTGAENDLQQVTLIARDMVVRWGMSPRVGPLSFAGEERTPIPAGAFQKPFSEATAALIDEEIRRIVEECLAEAQRLLAANRPRLDALARALLREESLDEPEILEVTGLPPREERERPAVAAGAS
jgi:cell division protease FtsH